jgi:hypothetical protein
VIHNSDKALPGEGATEERPSQRPARHSQTKIMADEQISLPSLILIVVLSGLAIRYLFFSPSTPATAAQQQQQRARDAASASRARESAVERIQQMFPQVDRRTILYDLQHTGGNISATTERILSGRVETVSNLFIHCTIESSSFYLPYCLRRLCQLSLDP